MFDPDKHHRRSIRLQGYDYTSAGAYFVTICAYRRECLFGDVVNSSVEVSPFGQLASEGWLWLKEQYSYVGLDAWVLMPNHLHGILVLFPEPGQKVKPLGRLIGAFKTVTTKQVNLLRKTPGNPLWQRNYYERIIRNGGELNAYRRYIAANPAHWPLDREHPEDIDL